MFTRSSFKLKLLCFSFLLSFVSMIVGITGYFGINKVISHYDLVADTSLPNTKLSDQMYLNFRQLRIALRTLGLPDLSKADADQAIKEARDAIASYEEANTKYKAVPFLPGEQELYDRVETNWNSFRKTADLVFSLQQSGKPDDHQKMIRIFMKECPESAKQYRTDIDRLVDFHQKHADAWVVEAKSAATSTLRLTLWIVALGLLFSIGLGILFSNSMNRTIGKVIQDLSSGAEQVHQASRQISGSSNQLSEASAQQASSLEETVATMEELTSMVKMNSENAQQASKMSESTRDIANQGETEILSLVNAIQDIATDSKKIEEIITVIDDIAFQTNLLALNAAVEAARAGDQGKGFAVVAEAVRNLAQRSAVAAQDIATLIQGSVTKISNGRQQAENGGKVLAEIVTSVKKVADLNQEISSASAEQSNGIQQIGQAMNQLDQVTQQNAGAAEQTASASEELSAQSETLRFSVQALKEIVEGRKAA